MLVNYVPVSCDRNSADNGPIVQKTIIFNAMKFSVNEKLKTKNNFLYTLKWCLQESNVGCTLTARPRPTRLSLDCAAFSHKL